MKEIRRLTSLIEFHRTRGLAAPKHPLISVVNYSDVQLDPDFNEINWVFDFHSITLKRNLSIKLKYGQQSYDFDEGVLFFTAPGQVLNITVQEDEEKQKSGWMLLIHPDFLWNTALAKKIKRYDFFDYSVSEALFLSDTEEAVLESIMKNINQEHSSGIDKFSQDIIISQIETLLNYSERFYQQQFITRKLDNHQILDKVEAILFHYFEEENVLLKGLPSVQYLTEKLNISAGYLSRLLKELTGKSTQQHIQDKVIERAKDQLSTTELSVSEIAFALGFEHSQSFSKMFKSKTQLSPMAFRERFN
jgi:AraC family transcriptional activator of pobA